MHPPQQQIDPRALAGPSERTPKDDGSIARVLYVGTPKQKLCVFRAPLDPTLTKTSPPTRGEQKKFHNARGAHLYSIAGDKSVFPRKRDGTPSGGATAATPLAFGDTYDTRYDNCNPGIHANVTLHTPDASQGVTIHIIVLRIFGRCKGWDLALGVKGRSGLGFRDERYVKYHPLPKKKG